ncbi:MAG: Rrf2 family transcriptional regulator [Bacteroidetes bacterium]|nr:Rrf2 family transcriptional regulator [Bacteroidota bacterium]MDA1121123.1 Rrf2 family transcriptional regulator [Bacteroidota bacterium]
MFSKSCQYALQAILYITLHSKNGSTVGLKEIAASQKIPIHFLSKILQNLVKHKILASTKGPNGGFVLNKSPNRLKLIKIVEITDGLDIFDLCGIGLKVCSDDTPCPIHFEYKVVKNKTKELLNTKTVSELCEDVEKGQSIVTYK